MNTQTTSKSSIDFQGTLLVIDDTPENLTVLRKCLSDHHYRVAVAKSGKVALERVKRIRPDLILLDVLMPGIDGFEVCRQLKADEMTRAIPVVFMTALDTSEDKVKGFEAGAEDYVTKPLNNQEVLARVRTHVTLYKVQQELQTRNIELQAAFEYVTGIYQSSLRLHRLIKNALLYARLRILNYLPDQERTVRGEEFIPTKQCIEQIALQKAQDVQRQSDLVLDVQDVRLRVSADNLEKILEEVLDNAFKFSQAGTPVRVMTMRQGNQCILTISDQGCGMTKDQIAGIEAYTQFDRPQHEQQGLGLGLIIVSLLVLWEGGKFSIISEPQHGMTVSIRLQFP